MLSIKPLSWMHSKHLLCSHSVRAQLRALLCLMCLLFWGRVLSISCLRKVVDLTMGTVIIAARGNLLTCSLLHAGHLSVWWSEHVQRVARLGAMEGLNKGKAEAEAKPGTDVLLRVHATNGARNSASPARMCELSRAGGRDKQQLAVIMRHDDVTIVRNWTVGRKRHERDPGQPVNPQMLQMCSTRGVAHTQQPGGFKP